MNLVLAASEDFEPQDEFELPAWVSIHIGPLDMSINKAVVYLLVGAAVTMHPRHLDHALRARPSAESEADDRRVALRPHLRPDRGVEPADQGALALVPLRRRALPLHLDTQLDRLHPVTDFRRARPRRRGRAADLGDLRGDREPLGDARARADHVRRDALRRASASTAPSATSRAGCRRERPGRSSSSSSRSRSSRSSCA